MTNIDDEIGLRSEIETENNGAVTDPRSEHERLMQELAELLSELHSVKSKFGDHSRKYEQSLLKAEIKYQAEKVGAIDVQDAGHFIDFSKITLDDKGNLVGVDAEMTRLKSQKPYLFWQRADSGRATGSTVTCAAPSAKDERARDVRAVGVAEYETQKKLFLNKI